MMNAARYAIRDLLEGFGLPLETGTGGQTKYNRTRAGMAKSHWADAACVGASTAEVWRVPAGEAQEIRAKSYARPANAQAILITNLRQRALNPFPPPRLPARDIGMCCLWVLGRISWGRGVRIRGGCPFGIGRLR